MNSHLLAAFLAFVPAAIMGAIAAAAQSGEGAITAVIVFTTIYFELVFGKRPR